MKAEELMIGDWVYYSSKKHIVQVVGISGIQYSFNQQDVILYGDCFKDFDGRGRWESHTTKSLSPIPLTPEILEKNGFIHYTVTDFYMLKEESSEPIHLDNYNENGWRLRINCDNIPCECKYVHQLQHALRLCGINKEIVL